MPYFQLKPQPDGSIKVVEVSADDVGRENLLAFDKARQWIEAHPEILDK